MTPAQQAKSYGLKSLTEASQICGTPTRTLFNWAERKPDTLFKAVMLGCVAMKEANHAQQDRG
jgi:hypothetical protein